MTLAENGRIALEKFDRETFDLVLMDMQMPEMGGAEAMGDPGPQTGTGGHMPIVSLTAHALKGNGNGASTPVRTDTCPSRSCQPPCSGKSMRPRRPRQRSGTSRATRRSRRLSDTLLARAGGSHDLIREIIVLFLEDSPKLVEEIRRRWRTATPAAYRAAHTLKGSVGNFDAHAAVEVAQRLEARAREENIEARRPSSDRWNGSPTVVSSYSQARGRPLDAHPNRRRRKVTASS